MKEKDLKTLNDLTSALISRSELAARAGLTFGGKRDLYKALGYTRTITFKDYLDRFKRGGIAARIVKAPARATWSSSPILRVGDDITKKTKFERAWQDLATQLNLFSNFEKADKLAGIGRFAVILIGIRGSGTKLERPVSKTVKAEDILYVKGYSEEHVKIKSMVEDPSDPRFGKPEIYCLQINNNPDAKNKRGFISSLDVHYSRILHIAEDALADEVFGTPRLREIWNYLDDLEKIIGGSSEAVWRRVDKGIVFNLDKEASITKDQEKDLTDEIEAYLHNMQRYLRVQGMEVTDLSSDAPDPTGAFQAVLSLIAGTTGIPQRILLGSERGQLASTQDRSSWAERIGERRETFAEPVILRPFIDWCIERKVLPDPREAYKIEWEDLMSMTDREKAEVARSTAFAIERAGRHLGTQIVGPGEFRSKYLGLPKDIPEDEIVEKPQTGVDENGNPIEVDENGKPIKKDENGQPIKQKEDTTDTEDGTDEE